MEKRDHTESKDGKPLEHDSGQSILDILHEKIGTKPGIALRDGGDRNDSTSARDDNTLSVSAKYAVTKELGRGGVGAVHLGRDRELGRDVAIKFLHEKYIEHPDVLLRFVEEAQIGGQLQHPGIVPVYDLGMTDGKPFFAMKLVRGESFAQQLKKRESPSSDVRRFLSIFEQICQTVAYAHTRGVVHRDLKSQNIMVGAFGEVQVVDWGLGKVLAREASIDTRQTVETKDVEIKGVETKDVETVRSQGHGTESIVGSAMGTPAYMPPEQARGDVDRMDERSDVFSLGAILCEILTGQPPYVGEGHEPLLMAAHCKLEAAHERLEQSGAERELITLVRQCMMPSPADRPGFAGVVAVAIQQHLAQADQRAHDMTVRAAALRRTQKLGIALLTVIAVGLTVSLWLWRSAEEATENENKAKGLALAAAEKAHDAQLAAEANLANFNRLSFVVRLENAKEKVQDFYPVRPETAPHMRTWRANEAQPLLDTVSELQATLTVVEGRAHTLDSLDKKMENEHPLQAELDNARHELEALQRAYEVRMGRASPSPFELQVNGLPSDAMELQQLARPLVDPSRNTFGRELEGLALAERAAAEKTSGLDRARILDTLSDARFAVGLDFESIQACQEAITHASGRERQVQVSKLNLLGASCVRAIVSAPRLIRKKMAQIREIESRIGRSRNLHFQDDADRFLHSTLLELVAEIDDFSSTHVAEVERSIPFAEGLGELMETRDRTLWEEARAAIRKADGTVASELYASPAIDLQPQVGLVPLGMNPETKLWEFLDLRSGWIPATEMHPGEIPVPSITSPPQSFEGIRFVLIPGGMTVLGSQSDNQNRPNYDHKAQSAHDRVTTVALEPYFLSKYELTQGQWARLTDGDYPSFYRPGLRVEGTPGAVDESHPVGEITWPRCQEVMKRAGFMIPTEAQWEHACRAGTSTPWHTGSTGGSLEGFANVLDETAANVPPFWTGGADYEDGYKSDAPVGTFRPNAFGMHDMHGNHGEWCRDWFARLDETMRPGDGLRGSGKDSGLRMRRGGSYRGSALSAKSTRRVRSSPTFHRSDLGIRPGREIEKRQK